MNYSLRGEIKDRVITGDVGERGRGSIEGGSSTRSPNLFRERGDVEQRQSE
jgi:hypothetical protein